MDKYLNLQHNNQLNPSEKEEDASQIIERLKKKHKENQEFKELFQEAKLESLGVNLTFYDKFYCPDTIRSIKTLPQLYSLTRNLNKNLSKETHIDDVANHTFMANKGCNLMQLERALKDLDMYVKHEKPPVLKEKILDKYNITSLTSVIIQLNVGKAYPLKEQKNIIPEIDKKIEDSLRNYDFLFCRNSNIPKFEKKSGTKTSVSKKIKNEESKLGSSVFFESKETANQQIGTPVKKLDNLSASFCENINMQPSLSEESLGENFDFYYDSFKFYFYFLIKNVSISDKKGLYSLHIDKHFVEIKILLQNLILKFDKKNDYLRKNLYKLIHYQFCAFDKQELSETKINKKLIISNTCRYYEDEYFLQIMDKFLNEKSYPQKAEMFEEYNYSTKLNAIKYYVNQESYQRFFNIASNLHNVELDSFKRWGCIFYFLRCGMIEDSIKFINEYKISMDEEFKLIENLLKKLQLNEDYSELEFSKLNEIIKTFNKGDIKNPYRLGVIVILSQSIHKGFSVFLPTFDDYIWFHLKIINISDKNEFLRDKILNFNYSLKDFQNLVSDISPQHFTNSDKLDYVRALFSIMLYEDGICHLYGNNNYLIDCINLCIILKPLNLEKNYHSLGEEKILSCNINRAINNMSFETILQKNLEQFIDQFVKSRFLQVVSYIQNFFKEKFVEKLSSIILKYNYFKSVLEPDSFVINVKINHKFILTDFLDKDQFNLLIHTLLEDSIRAGKNNFAIFNQILKKYNRYEDLILLFLNGQISILQSKVPRVIEDGRIHTKEKIIFKSSEECYKISDNDNYLDDIKKIRLQTNLSHNAKMNFKYLTQFELIGEIYQNLANTEFDKHEEILKKFTEKIDLLPIKISIDNLLDLFDSLNGSIKAYVPEIFYLYYYLVCKLKEKSIKIQMTLSNEKTSSYKYKLEEHNKYLNSLTLFLERLLNRDELDLPLLDRFKNLNELIFKFLGELNK